MMGSRAPEISKYSHVQHLNLKWTKGRKVLLEILLLLSWKWSKFIFLKSLNFFTKNPRTWLVNILELPTLTVEAVPLVSREAWAAVATDGVRAVSKHVTRPKQTNIRLIDKVINCKTAFVQIAAILFLPVTALIVVRHGAALAAPAVVTVALGVQAGAVHAPTTSRVQAVV